MEGLIIDDFGIKVTSLLNFFQKLIFAPNLQINESILFLKTVQSATEMGLVLLLRLALILLIIACSVLDLNEADSPRLVDVKLKPQQCIIKQVCPILDFSTIVLIFVLLPLDLIKYLAHHRGLLRLFARKSLRHLNDFFGRKRTETAIKALTKMSLLRVDQNVGFTKYFCVLREFRRYTVNHLRVLTRLELNNFLKSRAQGLDGF